MITSLRKWTVLITHVCVSCCVYSSSWGVSRSPRLTFLLTPRRDTVGLALQCSVNQLFIGQWDKLDSR